MDKAVEPVYVQEQAKRRAGVEAARLVEPGWVVGLGTGSTAAYAIEELGKRMREEGVSFVGVPTSYSAGALARRHGIPIQPLEHVERVHIAIDGADEVDPQKNLIKGAGGAHTQEKVVDASADLFVVVVDESKMVERLGTRAWVPVEILPMAASAVTRAIGKMGGQLRLRTLGNEPGHDGPFITEQGNLVMDVRFDHIDDPAGLECALNNLPGVVDNGIFAGRARAHLVLVASLTKGNIIRLE